MPIVVSTPIGRMGALLYSADGVVWGSASVEPDDPVAMQLADGRAVIMAGTPYPSVDAPVGIVAVTTLLPRPKNQVPLVTAGIVREDKLASAIPELTKKALPGIIWYPSEIDKIRDLRHNEANASKPLVQTTILGGYNA